MVSEVQLEDEESGSNVTTPSVSNITQESTQVPDDESPEDLEERPDQEPEVVPRPSENLLEEVILEEGDFEDPRESGNYQLPPRRMVALFDYDPQTLSPNPDSEVRTDQHLISPYNINALSIRQVMRIKKIINKGILP